MKSRKDKSVLSVNQKIALPHFLQPGLIGDKCKKAKITSDTFHLWRRTSPAWNKALDGYVKEVTAEAKHNVTNLVVKASEVLSNKLDSEDEKIQIRAIEIVLDYSTKWGILEELVKDVKELKAQKNGYSTVSQGVGAGNSEPQGVEQSSDSPDDIAPS